MSSELGLRRRSSSARSEDDEWRESGDEVRVNGDVVPVDEVEESEELEVELGEKAVLRRRREGVRRGEKDWKREVRMLTLFGWALLVSMVVVVMVGIICVPSTQDRKTRLARPIPGQR